MCLSCTLVNLHLTDSCIILAICMFKTSGKLNSETKNFALLHGCYWLNGIFFISIAADSDKFFKYFHRFRTIWICRTKCPNLSTNSVHEFTPKLIKVFSLSIGMVSYTRMQRKYIVKHCATDLPLQTWRLNERTKVELFSKFEFN